MWKILPQYCNYTYLRVTVPTNLSIKSRSSRQERLAGKADVMERCTGIATQTKSGTLSNSGVIVADFPDVIMSLMRRHQVGREGKQEIDSAAASLGLSTASDRTASGPSAIARIKSERVTQS
jgi:hypothetical protein